MQNGKGSSHASRINPSKFYSSTYWGILETVKSKIKNKKEKSCGKKGTSSKRK